MATFDTLVSDASFTNTVTGWFAARKGTGARSGLGAARAHAHKHGMAVIMLGDDSAVIFLLDLVTKDLRMIEQAAGTFEWKTRKELDAAEGRV